MKTPSWVYAIGIVMMLFGACGINKSVQLMQMPKAMQFGEDLVGGLTNLGKKAVKDSLSGDSIGMQTANQAIGFLSNTFGKMYTLSEDAKIWMVRLGYFGIFICLLYFVAAIFFMSNYRKWQIVCFTALGLSVVFSIFKYIKLSDAQSGGFFSISLGAGEIFSIILDIIIFVLIFMLSKQNINSDNQNQETHSI